MELAVSHFYLEGSTYSPLVQVPYTNLLFVFDRLDYVLFVQVLYSAPRGASRSIRFELFIWELALLILHDISLRTKEAISENV